MRGGGIVSLYGQILAFTAVLHWQFYFFLQLFSIHFFPLNNNVSSLVPPTKLILLYINFKPSFVKDKERQRFPLHEVLKFSLLTCFFLFCFGGVLCFVFYRDLLKKKEQKITLISETAPSELLQHEVLGFKDVLNDDLSLLLCSADVLW